MGFTIPNAPDASIPDQSEPDSVDFQALGNRTSGVVSGCVVTAAAVPNQTVSVSAGEVISNGTYRTIAATSVSLGQGDSSSPRFDLVVVNSAGALTVRSGAAGSNATFPALQSGDVLLAAVYRASGTGDIVTSSRIIDKAILQPTNAVRSGNGAPSNSIGAVGDVYINTALSSNAGQSQYWVKATSASWENLAEYTYPVATTNTGNTIVQRDASGNFSAGTITASTFSGPLSGAVTGNVTGNLTGNVTGNLTGTASNATLAAKSSTLAQNGGNGAAMTFTWSGQGGQPTWLWGSNNGTDAYVWNPANFSVSYASGAGNSNTVAGLAVHGGRNNETNKIVRTDGSGYLQVGYINSSSGNEGNNSNPPRVWGTNGSDDYLRSYLTSALSVGTSQYSTYWWAQSHVGSYYLVVNWDQSRWNITSNHGAPVRVGYADYALNAGEAGNADWLITPEGATFQYASSSSRWITPQTIETTSAVVVGQALTADSVYLVNNPTTTQVSSPVVRVGGAGAGQLRMSNTNLSMRELKENIQDAPSGIELLKPLRVRQFNWKLNEGDELDPVEVYVKQTQKTYGFIADEVESINIDLVGYGTDDDGQKEARSWKHTDVIALLVKAVQELSAEVEALKAEK